MLRDYDAGNGHWIGSGRSAPGYRQCPQPDREQTARSGVDSPWLSERDPAAFRHSAAEAERECPFHDRTPGTASFPAGSCSNAVGTAGY